jgi:hypothetical protein
MGDGGILEQLAVGKRLPIEGRLDVLEQEREVEDLLVLRG